MRDLPKPNVSELSRLVRDEAEQVGLALDDATIERLVVFAVLFSRWNQRINLASAATASDVVERHFIDSYVAARFIPRGARVVDVGSGGGLPALPLAAIRTDLFMDCFEPIQKKVAFLRTAVRELGMGGRVAIRGEAVRRPLPASLAGLADVAMSRATWEPSEWLDLGRELVRPGEGRVLVFATTHSAAPLPPPSESASYGRNRRLLCY